MGIVLALEWLAKDFATHRGIPCRLHIQDDSLLLSERSATAIFRIAQESLRNITRHAHACNVDVYFRHMDGMCFLDIRDDGCGFDPLVVPFNSFGLIGIRERALILGGEVEIESAEDQGTTIHPARTFNNLDLSFSDYVRKEMISWGSGVAASLFGLESPSQGSLPMQTCFMYPPALYRYIAYACNAMP